MNNYIISFVCQERSDADAIKFAHKIAEESKKRDTSNEYVELGPPGDPRFLVFHDGSVSMRKKGK